MKKPAFLVLLSLLFASSLFAFSEMEMLESGIRLFKQGQYQPAIDEFSKLIKLAPDNADAYKNRGVSYLKQEKFDLAIRDFEKARTLFPELKGLYSNLGVAWYYKKEYEKAIESYNMEIEMAPDNHIAYFNRALCLAELARNDEALDDLEKTLALRPDFYWALCSKADLLFEQGEKARAIETYEQAVRTDPDQAYASDRLAQIRPGEKKEHPVSADKVPLADSTQFSIQSGAFMNRENAGRLRDRLKQNGFDARILTLKDNKKRTWFLVRSGSYTDEAQARNAADDLMGKLGIKSVIRPVGSW